VTVARRVRQTARVIVLDESNRMLLLHGHDPSRPESGTWWFTAGGGIDNGETAEAGARRELFEETGLEVGALGPVVHRNSTEFEVEGTLFVQTQVFYLLRTRAFEVDTSGWDAFEQRTIIGYRWWSEPELRTAAEPIYPPELVEFFD
jgi:8-oxo-dGTP pyrophosphatase MutT (NUDIX family)